MPRANKRKSSVGAVFCGLVILFVIANWNYFYSYNRAVMGALAGSLPVKAGAYLSAVRPAGRDPNLQRWMDELFAKADFDAGKLETEFRSWPPRDRDAVIAYLRTAYVDRSPQFECQRVVLAGLSGSLPADAVESFLRCSRTSLPSLAFLRACLTLKAFQPYRELLEQTGARVQLERIQAEFGYRPPPNADWFFDDFDTLVWPGNRDRLHSFRRPPYRTSDVAASTSSGDTFLYNPGGTPARLTYVIPVRRRARRLVLFFDATNSQQFSVSVKSQAQILEQKTLVQRGRFTQSLVIEAPPLPVVDVDFEFLGEPSIGWTSLYGWGYSLEYW